MTNWAYDEPQDALAKYNRHVVVTEDMILKTYGDLDDWIVTNWAYKTDEGPGVTITRRLP